MWFQIYQEVFSKLELRDRKKSPKKKFVYISQTLADVSIFLQIHVFLSLLVKEYYKLSLFQWKYSFNTF